MYGHLLQDVSKLGSDLKIVTSNCTKLWTWCTACYKFYSGSSCTDKIKQHRELFFIFKKKKLHGIAHTDGLLPNHMLHTGLPVKSIIYTVCLPLPSLGDDGKQARQYEN